jgi:hypothetical protein
MLVANDMPIKTMSRLCGILLWPMAKDTNYDSHSRFAETVAEQVA